MINADSTGTQSELFSRPSASGRRDQIVLATKFGNKIDEQRRGANPAYRA